MNFNFSSFLSGSLRILNIANKTLPLIKEASPAINNIRKKYQTIKHPKSLHQPRELQYKNKPKKMESPQINNLPTFFR